MFEFLFVSWSRFYFGEELLGYKQMESLSIWGSFSPLLPHMTRLLGWICKSLGTNFSVLRRERFFWSKIKSGSWSDPQPGCHLLLWTDVLWTNHSEMALCVVWNVGEQAAWHGTCSVPSSWVDSEFGADGREKPECRHLLPRQGAAGVTPRSGSMWAQERIHPHPRCSQGESWPLTGTACKAALPVSPVPTTTGQPRPPWLLPSDSCIHWEATLLMWHVVPLSLGSAKPN